MSKDDSFVASSVVPEGSYLKNKEDSLKNFKAFGTYVKNNLNNYLDKIMTPEGMKEEVLGGHGLSGVGGVAATFVGKGAKWYDEAADRLAQELHDQGVDPREIWKQTGVRRWLSGNRQEISDVGLSAKTTTFKDPNLYHWYKNGDEYENIGYARAVELYNQGKGNNITSVAGLGDIVKHDELFKNYPDLADVRVQIDPKMKKGNAAYNPEDDVIYISTDDFYNGNTSPILHEIQHAIQQREGWQSGGSPKQFTKKDIYTPRVNDKLGINFYKPFELYQRLPGEMEARNTQARQFLTDAERRAAFPDDTAKEVPFSEMKVHKRKYGVKK